MPFGNKGRFVRCPACPRLCPVHHRWNRPCCAAAVDGLAVEVSASVSRRQQGGVQVSRCQPVRKEVKEEDERKDWSAGAQPGGGTWGAAPSAEAAGGGAGGGGGGGRAGLGPFGRPQRSSCTERGGHNWDHNWHWWANLHFLEGGLLSNDSWAVVFHAVGLSLCCKVGQCLLSIERYLLFLLVALSWQIGWDRSWKVGWSSDSGSPRREAAGHDSAIPHHHLTIGWIIISPIPDRYPGSQCHPHHPHPMPGMALAFHALTISNINPIQSKSIISYS